MDPAQEPTPGTQRAVNPRTGQPLPTAVIDEAQCIGCTLCIQACPFDAIVGATRRMHTVIESLCTGCELCIAPCPVDCISMAVVSPERVWTREQAVAAGARVKARKRRLERERLQREARLAARAQDDADPSEPPEATAGAAGYAGLERISAIVARALQRARARRSGPSR
jgi:electron transport complex protein RnfB